MTFETPPYVSRGLRRRSSWHSLHQGEVDQPRRRRTVVSALRLDVCLSLDVMFSPDHKGRSPLRRTAQRRNATTLGDAVVTTTANEHSHLTVLRFICRVFTPKRLSERISRPSLPFRGEMSIYVRRYRKGRVTKHCTYLMQRDFLSEHQGRSRMTKLVKITMTEVGFASMSHELFRQVRRIDRRPDRRHENHFRISPGVRCESLLCLSVSMAL